MRSSLRSLARPYNMERHSPMAPRASWRAHTRWFLRKSWPDYASRVMGHQGELPCKPRGSLTTDRSWPRSGGCAPPGSRQAVWRAGKSVPSALSSHRDRRKRAAPLTAGDIGASHNLELEPFSQARTLSARRVKQANPVGIAGTGSRTGPHSARFLRKRSRHLENARYSE